MAGGLPRGALACAVAFLILLTQPAVAMPTVNGGNWSAVPGQPFTLYALKNPFCSDITIDWGDGTAPETHYPTSNSKQTYQHTYGAPGTYRLVASDCQSSYAHDVDVSSPMSSNVLSPGNPLFGWTVGGLFLAVIGLIVALPSGAALQPLTGTPAAPAPRVSAPMPAPRLVPTPTMYAPHLVPAGAPVQWRRDAGPPPNYPNPKGTLATMDCPGCLMPTLSPFKDGWFCTNAMCRLRNGNVTTFVEKQWAEPFDR